LKWVFLHQKASNKYYNTANGFIKKMMEKTSKRKLERDQVFA
jgi:hypothetical protein